MRIPVIGATVDERFRNHRLQASSLAGIIGGFLAICLFAYRFYVNHLWSWDLFAVIVTSLGAKLLVMAWYRLND
jgi:hypothetical protein